MQKTKEVQQLIIKIKKECLKNNVFFKLVPDRVIKLPELNVCCLGIFAELQDGTGILKVAVKRSLSDWFPVLLHEYCHMQQWLHNKKLWRSAALSKIDILKYKKSNLELSDVTDIFDFWIDRKLELSSRKIKKYAKIIVDIELDCEKKVIALIKKHSFEIDTKVYIKKTNAYLYFYQFALKNRKWFDPSKDPSDIRGLWSEMPSSFNLDYFSYMAPKLNKLYEKNYAN